MYDGEELLREWKEIEAEWLAKVVDINQHRDLVSPYEPKTEKGERSCTELLTRH